MENVCQTCKGTGLVHKKAWTQGYDAEFLRRALENGVHPAILAVSPPAYRTVVSNTCPSCGGKKVDQEKSDGQDIRAQD